MGEAQPTPRTDLYKKQDIRDRGLESRREGS